VPDVCDRVPTTAHGTVYWTPHQIQMRGIHLGMPEADVRKLLGPR
jgi:hypothetical protein